LSMTGSDLRRIRGRVVSYAVQETGGALNPMLRVGTQIAEVLALQGRSAYLNDELIRLLKRVGIPDPHLRARSYPHELSGGMRQRICIAVALASRPELLVADEPTTAQDATVQVQILDLLRELRDKLGLAVLFVTHNLAIVCEFADRLAVMYAGQIVEIGPAKLLVRRQFHPYTKALIQCTPKAGSSKLAVIPGQVPPVGFYPSGCRFHPRCSWAKSECSTVEPDLDQVLPDHWVRCPYWSLIPEGTG